MTTTTTTEDNRIAEMEESMNTFFILINSFVIFFLQGGFAFLEAGSVRSKNTTNILIKNILDCLIGAMAFWMFGYMIANSSGNAFMGLDINYICLYGLDASHFANWFFGFVFCATASTIVSGAVAERCELTAYFVYSTLISTIVYPVVVHWAWTSEGWLSVNGYYDFAGSGVVHHLGGVCGLMGAIFLGPRIGRFDADGKVTDTLKGHSVSLAALGAFILMFGFFSFNGSTNAAVASEEDRNIVQRAVLNTVIGGTSSGFITLITFRFSDPKKWSLLNTINGTLCGMIATCAFCNAAQPWMTFVVGIVAAFIYKVVHHTVIWFRIDDPLDAFAVHSGGGMVGVLAAPFVIGEGGVFSAEDSVTAMHQIWSQVVGLLVITAWSASISSLIFYILKLNNKLRLPEEVEIAGCDIIKHGEAAYPAEAWVEAQYGQGLPLPPNMRSRTHTPFNIENLGVEESENEKNQQSTWDKLKSKMYKTNEKQASDVTVTPLTFKKLSEDQDKADSLSSSTDDSGSIHCKTDVLSGVVNNGFDGPEDIGNHDESLYEKLPEVDPTLSPLDDIVSDEINNTLAKN